MLKRMLAASGSSSSTDTVGSMTTVSRTKRPLYTPLGRSSWVVDSGASFHMTSDSSALYSVHSLDFPLNVLTTYDTSLSIASHGTFILPPFMFLMFLMFLSLP
jgi:hypothetical protein